MRSPLRRNSDETVTLSSTAFTDGELQGWVNELARDNHFFSGDCIFVVVPQGITAAGVGGNAGYHTRAAIPYVVAGVFASGLTLADQADVYAMVVSHEIAEMVVDPDVNGNNPEVCDPCDVNCNNLTRCYFDASDNFLGSNSASPPGGVIFSYYTCAIVKPPGAANCPRWYRTASMHRSVADISPAHSRSRKAQTGDWNGSRSAIPAPFCTCGRRRSTTAGRIGPRTEPRRMSPSSACRPRPRARMAGWNCSWLARRSALAHLADSSE